MPPFVDGVGDTPAMALYLVCDSARMGVEKQGVTVSRSLVGSYFMSLELQGCSMSVARIDAEIVGCRDAAVDTAALRLGM